MIFRLKRGFSRSVCEGFRVETLFLGTKNLKLFACFYFLDTCLAVCNLNIYFNIVLSNELVYLSQKGDKNDPNQEFFSSVVSR